MSHITAKSSYKKLEERINRFAEGAPPSETLYKILSLLFSEKEAGLVAQLPIRPFTVKAASRIWKMDEAAAHKILDELASRAILLDTDHDGVQKYVLPPPMAGFFEFTFMRTRNDIDQKLLSELFHQYLSVEEDFIKELFWGSDTKMGRVFPYEGVLANNNEVHILDFERASHAIKTAEHIGVSMCYCRHRAQHLGTACDAPMDVCLTFSNTAQSLIKHNYARRIDASEGIEILHMAYEHNLVQCGENVREEPSFMCNCCGCCCESMVAAKRFGMLHPIETTNFIPKIIEEGCIGCGKCVKACPIEAIKLIDVNVGENHNKKIAKVDEDICLGCGVCARNCHKKSIYLQRREQQIITPVNTTHRIVSMAIEKGKLQNLIFDNHAFGSHRAMAAVLSAILKLPPIKQAMASKQMKSVYLERLISKTNNKEC